MSGPLRASLIVAIVALGVPGVIAVGLLFSGQLPLGADTAVVERGPDLFTVLTAVGSPSTSLLELALAYALAGALAAATVSVGHWLLPYLANRPSEGADEWLARRVHRIQATARGLGYLEYPLLTVGTVAELALALTRTGELVTHLTLLMLYLALWLFQILLLMKRSVVGRVVTPRQQPVEWAVVRVIDPETHRVKATDTTDGSGRFTFTVHAGQYEIRAERRGYDRAVTTETVKADHESRLMLVLTAAETSASSQPLSR